MPSATWNRVLQQFLDGDAEWVRGAYRSASGTGGTLELRKVRDDSVVTLTSTQAIAIVKAQIVVAVAGDGGIHTGSRYVIRGPYGARGGEGESFATPWIGEQGGAPVAAWASGEGSALIYGAVVSFP